MSDVLHSMQISSDCLVSIVPCPFFLYPFLNMHSIATPMIVKNTPSPAFMKSRQIPAMNTIPDIARSFDVCTFLKIVSIFILCDLVRKVSLFNADLPRLFELMLW